MLYEKYHKRIENLTDLHDVRYLIFEMIEEKADILKDVLPKLREQSGENVRMCKMRRFIS